jgi:WD40 repeat protein/transcriptional regulator with XRE-family HTH domain
MDTSHSSESFRGLLLQHRGRSHLIQRDLAARAGVSLRSIQDWEAGVKFPGAERLQALIRALLESGGLSAGQERSQARELWAAVEHEAPRMRTPFDEQWFAALLAAHAAPNLERSPDGFVASHTARPASDAVERAQDWGEAPDTIGFVGRAEELELLRGWVLEERSRLVALFGMGGIGKTSLAARFAQQIAPSFDRIYWRSMRNAPPFGEWLPGAIAFLSDQRVVPLASQSERITALLQLLRARRCLLVLDNFESVFDSGHVDGRYRALMDGYGRILQAVGETSHQSCLMLTSRELPAELSVLRGGCRWLELNGLGVVESQALLADKQLRGDTQVWASLVHRYGGNGLALRVVGETIRQVCDGDIANFLREAVSTGAVFGGIRRLLDAQAERLSHVEHYVMRRLAVDREPINLEELSRGLGPTLDRSAVVEAIETLRRRSLVERGGGPGTFTLQSMVLEYVTDRLVENVAEEILSSQPVVLFEQPLIKAQAKDYVRQMQERIIGTPILQRLSARDTDAATESRLLALLAAWRDRSQTEQGYGPGNVVNLVRLLRGDLRNMDLSQLTLRQVYLQGVDAQSASLVRAQLIGAVLDEAFTYASAVALTTDGALLVAGTPAGEVRLWRAADRTPLLAFEGHAGVVWSVAISGDGRLVASGGVDGTVRLWDGANGQPLFTLQGHTSGVRGVALSRDGRIVASGGDDGTVRLWEAATGQPTAILPGHGGGVRAVALSRDGTLVASGGVDETVRLWNVEAGRPAATLQGHAGVVWDVALSGAGQLVASGGVDGTVRLWDAQAGLPLATLQGHAGVVWDVALSEDGRLVASGGVDGTVQLWEVSSGRTLATLLAHAGGVLTVDLSGEGRLLASGGNDGTVRLWDTASTRLLATLQGRAGGVRAVALSANGRLVASGGVDGAVRLWDAENGHLMANLDGYSGVVYAVALSQDGQLVVTGGDDGQVRRWVVAGGRPLPALQGHVGPVWSIALSREGQLVVASGGDDGVVRLWDAASGQSLATLRGHTGGVRAVAVSADGQVVASASWDGTVRLWHASREELISTLRGHTGGVRAVALSADARLIASGGDDGTVRLWDPASGQATTMLERDSGGVRSVVLSVDGQFLASGGVDRTVRLWDAEAGLLAKTLDAHTGLVWDVAMSWDGRLLASASDDGTVRLWDAVSGACLRTLRSERHYERLDITGMSGVTDAQRSALLSLGAIERGLTVSDDD